MAGRRAARTDGVCRLVEYREIIARSRQEVTELMSRIEAVQSQGGTCRRQPWRGIDFIDGKGTLARSCSVQHVRQPIFNLALSIFAL